MSAYSFWNENIAGILFPPLFPWGRFEATTGAIGAFGALVRLRENPQKPKVSRGFSGAQGRIRTTDTRIFSPLLYRLSYLGKQNTSII